MSKPNLLFVDSDPRNRQFFEVSLRKAGFMVTTATDGLDALRKIEIEEPQIVIAETDLPNLDGFALCDQLKRDPRWKHIPFVFLTEQQSIEDKIRGLELGGDEYLTKPIFIKEIVVRLQSLVSRRQRARMASRDSRTTFSGDLADMAMVDLIQTLELSRKSGLIHFSNSSSDQEGTIYFRNGKIIDGELGHFVGKKAVYRLLVWNEGQFAVKFEAIDREDVIGETTQAILMDGMRHVDEWGRLIEQLPRIDKVLVVDPVLSQAPPPELPGEVLVLTVLFDGTRSILEVVDECGLEDTDALNGISQLYFAGIIYDPDQGPISIQHAPASGVPGPEPMPTFEHEEEQSGLEFEPSETQTVEPLSPWPVAAGAPPPPVLPSPQTPPGPPPPPATKEPPVAGTTPQEAVPRDDLLLEMTKLLEEQRQEDGQLQRLMAQVEAQDEAQDEAHAEAHADEAHADEAHADEAQARAEEQARAEAEDQLRAKAEEQAKALARALAQADTEAQADALEKAQTKARAQVHPQSKPPATQFPSIGPPPLATAAKATEALPGVTVGEMERFDISEQEPLRWLSSNILLFVPLFIAIIGGGVAVYYIATQSQADQETRPLAEGSKPPVAAASKPPVAAASKPPVAAASKPPVALPPALPKPVVKKRSYAMLLTQAEEVLRRPQRWEIMTKKQRKHVYQLLQDAVKVNPDGWQALQELALIELKLGNLDRSLQLALKAEEVHYDAPYAQLVVGAVLQEKGMNLAAKSAYKRFLRLCPKCRYANEIRAVLKGM